MVELNKTKEYFSLMESTMTWIEKQMLNEFNKI